LYLLGTKKQDEDATHRHSNVGGLAMLPSQPSLPTNRAFVVQFRTPSTGTTLCHEGRVEHLVSGQVARFHSLEELLAFMRRMLDEVQEQSDTL
jgi:hypothetical protein